MFKTMTSCLNKNARPTDDEISKIPSFIFCRWLSGHPGTLNFANLYNFYNIIPIQTQWKTVHNNVAGKINYIPYPKNIKENDNRLLDILQYKYSINIDNAKDYASLMTEESKNKLIKQYENYERLS